MNAQQLLTRLQDSTPGGALDRLATLVVEHELSQPLSNLLPPSLFARAGMGVLQGWLASPTADAELTSALQHVQKRFTGDERTVREALTPELAKAALELAARRYSPDRDLVFSVLNRPPVRALVGGLLRDVLIEFSRKVSAPVTENRLTKGFTGLARFAAEQARNSGTLGGIAGALSDELERQVEKRAREFVDSALSGIIQQVADALSDPTRHTEHAEMRVALLDGVLDLELSRLARELSQADVAGSSAVVRKALTQWLASGRAQPELEALAVRVMERDGKRPVREVLGALGLLSTFQEVGRESVRGRLGPIVGSEPFARWLDEVMR